MKTKLLLFIIAIIFVNCKKQKIKNESVPAIDIKYHFSQTLGQVRYYIVTETEYENGDTYYRARVWNNPIDTLIAIPYGKVVKSYFHYTTVFGNANPKLEIYINNSKVDEVDLNNSNIPNKFEYNYEN